VLDQSIYVGYDFCVSMADILFKYLAHKQRINFARFMQLIRNENEIYFP